MSWIGAAKMAGNVISGVGEIWAGNEAKKAADTDAARLRSIAGMRRSESQRAAIEERRQARLKLSRARAVAASSGAGVSDPTVINLMGDIDAEGEYRFMSRLYEGEAEAQDLEYRAYVRKNEGQARRTAGRIGAITSVLGSASSLNTKYG